MTTHMTTPWSVQFWCEAAPEHGLMFTLEGGKYLELYQLKMAGKGWLNGSKDAKGWYATGIQDTEDDTIWIYRKYIGSTEKADLLDFAETLSMLVRRSP